MFCKTISGFPFGMQKRLQVTRVKGRYGATSSVKCSGGGAINSAQSRVGFTLTASRSSLRSVDASPLWLREISRI